MAVRIRSDIPQHKSAVPGMSPGRGRPSLGWPAIHLKLARDADGRPVDALHIHGDAARDDSELVEKAIWSRLGTGSEPPACLGRTREGQRTEPLAITQLLLVYHLLDAAQLFRVRALSCWHDAFAFHLRWRPARLSVYPPRDPRRSDR